MSGWLRTTAHSNGTGRPPSPSFSVTLTRTRLTDICLAHASAALPRTGRLIVRPLPTLRWRTTSRTGHHGCTTAGGEGAAFAPTSAARAGAREWVVHAA